MSISGGAGCHGQKTVKRAAVILLAVLPLAHADFAIRADEASQRYTMYDGERPVLTYNFGTIPVPAGVGGKYAVARSDYVHPLYGPSGEVLTLDYSKDHPHHRGIYWAWPEVAYKGETRDLHALQGVFARPVKIIKQEGGKEQAELIAENEWKWGDQEAIVRETATVRAGLEKNGVRPIDFRFRFEPLVDGVALARRGQSHYGGFNLRMSPRQNLRIDKQAATWAEASGTPPNGTEPIGLLLLQSPMNPGYPGDWVDYPDLPWLQPAFPAKGTVHALQRGAPLELAFRVLIRRGAGLTVAPETLLADYTATLPNPLERLRRFAPGQSRSEMTQTETMLRSASAAERRTLERQVLEVLFAEGTTPDFRRWACQQLLVAGSDDCVSAMTRLLADDAVWMQASDVLLARPGDSGLAALRDALPTLPPARRASLLHGLGMRRDARAVPLLAREAKATEPEVARAAVAGLAAIGTGETAELLRGLTVIKEAGDALQDARLAEGERLTVAGEPGVAKRLYHAVWDDPAVRPWQRGAALRGLAVVGDVAAVDCISSSLSSDNAHLRRGAAAALKELGADRLAMFRGLYGGASDEIKLVLLGVWAGKGVTVAEPEIIETLRGGAADLKRAAVGALRRAGTGKAVEPLLDTVLAGGEAGKEARFVLLELEGEPVTAALRAAMQHADVRRAAEATGLVGDRRDPGYLDAMLSAIADGRPVVMREALIALRNDGAPAHLPALRRALLISAEPEAREVARAITGICRQQADRASCLGPVLEGSPALTGTARAAMLASIPEIGGALALAFVARQTDEAAVRALINWPDAGACDPLLGMIEDSATPPALRDLAVAGFVRFAKRVLSSVAQAKTLPRVLPHLADPAVREQTRVYIEELKLRNLALKKSAVGSRPPEEGHPPAHAVDGDKTLGSYWGCTPPPSSLTVDLERTEQVGRVRVTTYWDGGRFYQYVVETSMDGTNWMAAADLSTNREVATAAGMMHEFKPRDARYIRVTMIGNSVNPGLHIVELEAFVAMEAVKQEASQ
jgi:HEAT repeat protein